MGFFGWSRLVRWFCMRKSSICQESPCCSPLSCWNENCLGPGLHTIDVGSNGARSFLIALIGDIISSLSVCYCGVSSKSGTLMHPNLAHLLLITNQQQSRESNKLAFCSSITTSTLMSNPITTDLYFLTLNGPASNARTGHLRHRIERTHRSPKAWSSTACTHIITRSQTNHSQMDVLPAHLNRDSFRGSFKGLVALEIIFDLPFGFPINNIISHLRAMQGELINYRSWCEVRPAVEPNYRLFVERSANPIDNPARPTPAAPYSAHHTSSESN